MMMVSNDRAKKMRIIQAWQKKKTCMVLKILRNIMKKLMEKGVALNKGSK